LDVNGNDAHQVKCGVLNGWKLTRDAIVQLLKAAHFDAIETTSHKREDQTIGMTHNTTSLLNIYNRFSNVLLP